MPKLKYVGPHEAVDLYLPDGPVRVERLHEVEVPASVRDEKAKSDDWTEVKTSSKKED